MNQTKMKTMAVALLLAGTSLAQAEVTISPMVGYHVFDSDTAVENHTEGSLALGYRATPHVAVELRYAQSNPRLDDVDGDLRYEAGTLDAYYNFLPESRLQPYALIGGGLARGTAQGYEEHTIANVALGVFYRLVGNLSLRAELRGIEDLQESDHDGVVSLGLLYAFAGKPATPVAPVPAVMPPGDDDQDGVINPLDKCPGTPRNVVVDADGCPKTRNEIVMRELKVLFDTDKSVVKPQYHGEIEAVAKLMQEFPEAAVEVQGHTDSTASDAYNMRLSQRRADAVVKILVNKFGIAASRVTSKGYGESQPVADNKTAEGRAKNRRTVAQTQGEVKVIITK